MQRIVVIIPTYNERENIKKLIPILEENIFPKIEKYRMDILVVDDKSPDGTAGVVNDLREKYKNLYLSLGEKQGLGAAYKRGMRYAMQTLKADAVIEFDADFQHDPKYIVDLVGKFNKGYEHVLGSRNIPGGKVPEGWGFHRKFVSYFGNLYTRAVLFLPDFDKFRIVTDTSTGLKLTKVKGVLDRLNFNQVGDGFYYKTQMLYQLVNNKVKIGEIPIEFKTREKGETKMPLSNVINTFKEVTLLRLNDPQTAQFLKFAVVGFIGYLINASTLALFTSLDLPELLKWALAAEMSIISNFTLNNLWTFASVKITAFLKLISKFLQFNLTSAGALLIQTVFGTLGVRIFGPEYRQLLLPFIIVFLVLPYNYFMYTHVIWKTSAKKTNRF
jgi:dolichol-phosphate mannosyltransferase